MRRVVILLSIFTLAAGFFAGCEKDNTVTGPAEQNFTGQVGVPDELALAAMFPRFWLTAWIA